MDVVYDLVVVIHLLGMAALVGGFFAVFSSPTAGPLMVWGARTQLVTGLVLAGLGEAVDSLDKVPDHNKLGLKLLVAIAVLAFVEVARVREKKGGHEPGMVSAAGWLAVLNVVVAAGWN
ncbi:hypothetical protein [Luteipulveratus mongoliensis]|uniref:Membrane protein n=1 Tax=Luteipulveratus mongoliensis TaxID=571913 RepID=A0A0K1JH78_9MICO|nr:hypothetical protein [Luteipulveratus mongoliensis]AKU16064.1 membrane protein [Luteipulveratus mongoliensis]